MPQEMLTTDQMVDELEKLDQQGANNGTSPAPQEPPADAATSETTQTPAAESEDTSEPVPFHEHPRWKQVMGERDEARLKAEQAAAETEALRQKLTEREERERQWADNIRQQQEAEARKAAPQYDPTDPEQVNARLDRFERQQAAKEEQSRMVKFIDEVHAEIKADLVLNDPDILDALDVAVFKMVSKDDRLKPKDAVAKLSKTLSAWGERKFLKTYLDEKARTSAALPPASKGAGQTIINPPTPPKHITDRNKLIAGGVAALEEFEKLGHKGR